MVAMDVGGEAGVRRGVVGNVDDAGERSPLWPEPSSRDRPNTAQNDHTEPLPSEPPRAAPNGIDAAVKCLDRGAATEVSDGDRCARQGAMTSRISHTTVDAYNAD